MTIQSRTYRSARADLDTPERDFPGDDDWHMHNFDLDDDYDRPKHVLDNNLQTLRSSDFQLVAGTAMSGWHAMDVNWSMEAAPGEFCMRPSSRGERDPKPEGIIVAVRDDVPRNSERFVVLWFA